MAPAHPHATSVAVYAALFLQIPNLPLELEFENFEILDFLKGLGQQRVRRNNLKVEFQAQYWLQ